MRLTYPLPYLLCLLWFGFGIQVAHGQSMPWHPMPHGQLALFDRGNNPSFDSYQAIRTDSLRLEGADSAYYFFRCFRDVLPSDTVFDCQGFPLNQPLINAMLVDLDHRMGKKMLLRSDSVCAFVFSNGDTFLLKSQARIGDSWPWGDSATAAVDTIVQQMVLGQADSVKVIHISSGGKILLSKQYGIVQSLPFQPVLNYSGLPDTLSWYLWGIPRLSLGGHFPTFEERYFHQVGDVWVHIFTEGNLAAQAYNSGYYRQMKIVGSLPGNPYQYQVEQQQLSYFPFGQVGSIIGPTIYNFGYDSTGYDAYGRLPGEWFPNGSWLGGILSDQGSYNGRYIENTISGGSYDSCAKAMVYIDGSSKVIGTIGNIYSHYWDGGDFDRMDLTCFAIGTDIWGSCPNLQALGIDPATATKIEAYPIPANDVLHITLPEGESIASLELLDLGGRVVARGESSGHATNINVAQLASGFYLLRLQDADGRLQHMRVSVGR